MFSAHASVSFLTDKTHVEKVQLTHCIFLWAFSTCWWTKTLLCKERYQNYISTSWVLWDHGSIHCSVADHWKKMSFMWMMWNVRGYVDTFTTCKRLNTFFFSFPWLKELIAKQLLLMGRQKCYSGPNKLTKSFELWIVNVAFPRGKITVGNKDQLQSNWSDLFNI